MEEQIKKLEDRLLLAEGKIEINEEADKVRLENFNAMSEAIESAQRISEYTLERFELIELKLSNKDIEIEILNTNLRTMEININMFRHTLEHTD